MGSDYYEFYLYVLVANREPGKPSTSWTGS